MGLFALTAGLIGLERRSLQCVSDDVLVQKVKKVTLIAQIISHRMLRLTDTVRMALHDVIGKGDHSSEDCLPLLLGRTG